MFFYINTIDYKYITMDNNDTNELIVAIKSRNNNKIDKLINSNYDVNLLDKNKRSALMFASNINDNNTIQKIIDKDRTSINYKDKNGMTALHFALKYAYVCKKNQNDINYNDAVIKLLNNGCKYNIEDNYKNNIFDMAIMMENEEIIDKIFELSNEKNDNFISYKYIIKAIKKNNVSYKCFIFLYDIIKKYKKFNILQKCNNIKNDEYTINKYVFHSVHINDIEQLKKFLFDGFNVNTLNHNNNTILSISIKYNFDEISRLILSNNLLNINYIFEDHDISYLMYALYCNNSLEIIKLILNINSLNNKNYMNKWSVCALYIAVNKSLSFEIIKELISNGIVLNEKVLHFVKNYEMFKELKKMLNN